MLVRGRGFSRFARRRDVVVQAAVLVLLFAGCSSARIAPDLSSVPVSKGPGKCQGLSGSLGQVFEAGDRIATAKRLGLRVVGDRVQVLITLAVEDASFLDELGAERGSRSGDRIQALVPVERLCELAERPEVIVVAVPPAIVAP